MLSHRRWELAMALDEAAEAKAMGGGRRSVDAGLGLRVPRWERTMEAVSDSMCRTLLNPGPDDFAIADMDALDGFTSPARRGGCSFDASLGSPPGSSPSSPPQWVEKQIADEECRLLGALRGEARVEHRLHEQREAMESRMAQAVDEVKDEMHVQRRVLQDRLRDGQTRFELLEARMERARARRREEEAAVQQLRLTGELQQAYRSEEWAQLQSELASLQERETLCAEIEEQRMQERRCFTLELAAAEKDEEDMEDFDSGDGASIGSRYSLASTVCVPRPQSSKNEQGHFGTSRSVKSTAESAVWHTQQPRTSSFSDDTKRQIGSSRSIKPTPDGAAWHTQQPRASSFRDELPNVETNHSQQQHASVLSEGDAVNDDGAQVQLGTSSGYRDTFYCGRIAIAIPGTDGRCGPAGGPQCNSCRRFQQGLSSHAGSSGREQGSPGRAAGATAVATAGNLIPRKRSDTDRTRSVTWA